MRRKGILNRNSKYFLLLTGLHLLMLFVLVMKKRQKHTWILLIGNMGLAYIFEYFVLNLFRGYTYSPSVMKKRFLDNIFGAILSQGVYVPITSTLITVFKGDWKWKAGFSLYFYLIEKMFIRLKLYKVHWWKPYYTLILMVVYFYLSEGMFKLLLMQNRWMRKIVHFLSIEVTGVTLLYCTAASRKIRFGRGLFHTWREHFIIAPLYSIALSFIAATTSSREGIQNRIFLLLGCSALDLFLVKTKILKMKVRQIFSNIPFHFFMIVVSRALYKWIFKDISRSETSPGLTSNEGS
jgi:hypothetical protein